MTDDEIVAMCASLHRASRLGGDELAMLSYVWARYTSIARRFDDNTHQRILLWKVCAREFRRQHARQERGFRYKGTGCKQRLVRPFVPLTHDIANDCAVRDIDTLDHIRRIMGDDEYTALEFGQRLTNKAFGDLYATGTFAAHTRAASLVMVAREITRKDTR